MTRILLVDDEPSILSVLSTLLRAKDYEINPVLGGEKALEILRSEEFDLMISDIRMKPINGLEVLSTAKKNYPNMAVIMITAYGSVETAVEALKQGAFDYVTKPFKVDELLITVQRALEYRNAITENVSLKAQLETRYSFDNLVAESQQMRKICQMIKRVAPTDQTVLITGESGVGKEVIAKAVHTHSVRKKNPFVPINCAALPETLLESELFGHAKGSFTGATTEKKGLFEEAHLGTIFLDEIGSMPFSLQGKLLRVIQEKEVRKVGSTKTIKVDARVIAASNVDLDNLIRMGNFREDLFYRLSVIPIHLPPLRERREDILPLTFHFIREVYQGRVDFPKIDKKAQKIILNYDWPGNVRELENAIRHATTFSKEGRITSDALPAKVVYKEITVSHAEGKNSYVGKSLKAFLRSKEKEYISSVITHYGGDKERAALALKISLATLYRKLPEPQ